MNAQFELEWLGGAPAARLRKRRPGIEQLPWGTLDTGQFEPERLAEARRVWTNGAFTEYASAAAFTALAGAFLEAGAPIDLTAAASDCAVDELTHTELVSRLVMELGGAYPFEADLEKVAPATTHGVRPLLRAAELAVKVSLVGEALSVPMLSASLKSASHPLTRAVLERVLRDEGAHSRIGHWFFEWAHERLDAADLRHLGDIAGAAISVYAPLWRGPTCERCVLATDFGGVGDYQVTLREAAQTRVVPALAKWGIEVFAPAT